MAALSMNTPNSYTQILGNLYIFWLCMSPSNRGIKLPLDGESNRVTVTNLPMFLKHCSEIF